MKNWWKHFWERLPYKELKNKETKNFKKEKKTVDVLRKNIKSHYLNKENRNIAMN
jgi:hypothetical protein